MAREYEVSERIFDLPVSEQGIPSRLAQLLSGLREGDATEARGEPGEVHRARGVTNAVRIKDRYDGRRLDPGMTPERAVARLEEASRATAPAFAGWRRSPTRTFWGHVQRVCASGQDKMGAWTRTVGIDEHTSSQRGRQSTRSQTSDETDVLRQAGKR